jgi:hypothetical protein
MVGIFITLADATGPMKTEAVKAGFYETPHHGKVPRCQSCKSLPLPIYSQERNRKFPSLMLLALRRLPVK